jgi:DNA-binding MarR family transcriptional regulator
MKNPGKGCKDSSFLLDKYQTYNIVAQLTFNEATMAQPDEQSLGRMIYFLAQEIKNLAERVLAPYDLTLEQFLTLKALSRTSGMTQRQLGQAINKNPANMTRILDRLEAKSLISRHPDSTDRRAYSIYLTDRGLVLRDQVIGVFEKFSTGVHAGLSQEMKRSTRKVLERMAANAEGMTAALKKDQK